MDTLKYERLGDQAFEALKKYIIYRRVSPGEKLNIKELSDKLGVSREPISEAFTRLEAAGLIIRKNRVGTFVAPLTRTKIEEMFNARLMVETWVTENTIRHLSKKDIDYLKKIHKRADKLLQNVTEKTFDYLSFSEYDHQFHLVLVKPCNNSTIIRFYESLNSHAQIARVYSLRALERSRSGHAEHQAILDAFTKKNVAEAKESQHEHLENSKANVLNILRKKGEL